MNRPNLASRNHFILASCEAGAGSAPGAVWAAWMDRQMAAMAAEVIDKIRAERRFMEPPRGDLPLPHNRGGNSTGRRLGWHDRFFAETPTSQSKTHAGGVPDVPCEVTAGARRRRPAAR